MRYIDTGAAKGKVLALLTNYLGIIMDEEPKRFLDFVGQYPDWALIIVDEYEKFETAAFIRTQFDWDYSTGTRRAEAAKNNKKALGHTYVMVPRYIAMRESGELEALLKTADAWMTEKI
jgi:hypothetical protein